MSNGSPARRSSGTLQTQRVQLPWPEGKRFRILSIDGGGIRGILPAKILTELEEKHCGGRSIGDYFDLIAGTSTGGIVALGLSLGIPAAEILKLYIDKGKEVFPRRIVDRLPWGKFVRNTQYYRFDAASLDIELAKVFGERTLGHAKRRLCIPTFDGFTEVFIFKTPHHPDYRMDWKEKMVTAARATAAAPTFFPVYGNGGRYFADGGVWANNPIMIGLIDALACYKLERRQIEILSLGTGDTELSFTPGQVAFGGMWDWKDIMSSAMHLQSQNAIGQAGLLIGRDHLLRINPKAKTPIDLDDYARASNELPPMATELVKNHAAEITERFLTEPADAYEAFYGPRKSVR